MILAPILHWPTDLLWQYIREEGLPYCRLYDEGFSRIGCIGCPSVYRKTREEEFVRYPRIEQRWRKMAARVFQLIKERHEAGLYRGRWYEGWTDADAYFDWWLNV
jgi:phosphoadenosine phosphosulfate reductase